MKQLNSKYLYHTWEDCAYADFCCYLGVSFQKCWIQNWWYCKAANVNQRWILFQKVVFSHGLMNKLICIHGVVLRSQTLLLFFLLYWVGKNRSGILTIKFLSQISPVQRWAMIDVNFCYREVINHTCISNTTIQGTINHFFLSAQCKINQDFTYW